MLTVKPPVNLQRLRVTSVSQSTRPFPSAEKGNSQRTSAFGFRGKNTLHYGGNRCGKIISSYQFIAAFLRRDGRSGYGGRRGCTQTLLKTASQKYCGGASGRLSFFGHD